MISETQTLGKDDIASILIRLCSSEVDLGPSTVTRWSNAIRFQTLTFVTNSSVLNAAGVLNPPMPKARRVEQNTRMVSDHSHG